MPLRRWRKFKATLSRGENGTRATANLQNRCPTADHRAVGLHDLDAQAWIDPPENRCRDFASRDHRAFFREDARRGLLVFGDEILRRDIALPDIFAQREVDQEKVVSGKIHGGQNVRADRRASCTMGRKRRSDKRPETKKDPGRARRRRNFECEDVPPPESP